MINLLLKRKIKEELKKNFRKKTFLNLKDIHTILILFDTENQGEVDVFIKHLKRAGKKVTAYGYKSKKDTVNYSGSSYKIIHYKKVSGWFNNQLNAIATEINRNHYHALFDLTIRENLALEFLYTQVDAPLKVGYKKNNWFSYDVSFSSLSTKEKHENAKVKELGKQIIHYLSTIQSSQDTKK
jgi:hypothetical protein